MSTGDKVKVTFNDVAGADEAKEELAEVVEFLQHPKKFNDLGLAQQVLRTMLARYDPENSYINLCVNSLNHVIELYVLVIVN